MGECKTDRMAAGRGKAKLLFASSSVAALLVGGGAPAAWAAPCTNTITGPFTNPAATTAANVCVHNTSFTGNIINEGTISPSGVALVNGTISGFIFSNGLIQGGISIDNQSKIATPLGSAIVITGVGQSFAGGVTNAGIISGVKEGIDVLIDTFSGGITNSGSISAPTVGIDISSPTFTGGISNTGTISAGFAGLEVGSSSTFSGGITNGGTIAVGSVGIVIGGVSTFSGNISNSGMISGKTGISVSSSTINGSIVDNGTILATNHGISVDSTSEVVASGLTPAIAINGPTFTGGISNAGTLSAAGTVILVGTTGVGHGVSTFAGGISNAGTIKSAIYTGIYIDVVSTFTGGISNSGTISVGREGIIVENVGTFAGGIANSGKLLVGDYGDIDVLGVSAFSGGISNSGMLTAGLDAIVVNSVSTFTGGIANSGTIAAGNSGAGIALVDVSIFSGGISNSGKIISSANDTGIQVGSNTFVGNISNSGTITAGTDIKLSSGVTTFAGGIVNTGTLAANRTGIFIGELSTFTGGISNSGTISGGDHGILIEGMSAFAGGISNAGTIAGGVSGIFIDGASTFTGGISNSGVITSAVSYGIASLNISIFSGGVANSGTVAGVGGIVFGNVSSFGGGVSNSGMILAKVGTGAGILVGSISTFTGGISNSGTIGTAQHGDGIAVRSISTFSGDISNSGGIAAGVGILIGAGVTFAGGAAVANSGTITGTNGTAIDASAATSPVTIDQTGGVINGTIKLSVNADVFNISGGAINGNIVGQGASDTLNFALGGGTFTYNSPFTGVNQVNIDSGTVVLNGANSATNVDVVGGTLAGSGSIDPTTVTIHSGATFAPGTPGVPGTSMAITGSLAFQSGALYLVYLDATVASSANITGSASLAGAVDAVFESVAKKYTILTASGGLGGTTFSGLTNIDLPAGATDSLSYDADHVYLNVTAPFSNYSGLNINQQNVANGLTNVFNNGGSIPVQFFGLTPAGLTQVDGEVATGAAKGAFQLMNDFLNMMLDPTSSGGGNVGAGGASGFAPEQDSTLPADVTRAYADVLKAPQVQQTFDQRWSAWGSAFGGSSSTSGNAVIGSNNVTASDYGFAAGLDYHATPDTIFGFGLAGGGTGWNLAQGLGNGRSDAFQAGVYAKTHWGPAYVSAALAFANHQFTTDRTALGDQLTAKFEGQSYAARLETGYRYAVPITGAIVGVTPYAALQVQDFHTPSYSETDLTGGGFGLTYSAMNATDTRSELGVRSDNLQIIYGMPLVLRGRLAWAYDWITNPALGAVFQTLPGSNFTVNGAASPKNSALATAAAELHLTANWTAIAKFDGAFGSGAQTYGGTGTLKYSW